MADTVTPTMGFKMEDMTVQTALQQVFAVCKNHNKLALGSAEVLKCLMRASSPEDTDALRLVVMAKDHLQDYQSVILQKCQEAGVPVIYVEDHKQLAEISPIKRVKRMGVIGIKDFVYDSREKAFIANAYKN
ncbi:small subunit ribosomal protein S12e [Pancytospora epiphaga]|nr:small subunit ribosomal protein S12e [Pancytospora epiphaga]